MTQRPHPSRRDFLRAGALAAGTFAALVGCSDRTPEPGASSTSRTPVPGAASSASPSVSPADSWAPRPVEAAGLTVLCSRQGDRLTLSTEGGDRTFLAGVGVSGRLPGTLGDSAAAADHRRWLRMMGQVGVRVVRLDRLAPPAFYAELAAYDRAHPDAPIYLMQGISVAPPRGVAGQGLTDATRKAWSAEIAATSAAVHGDLTRRSAEDGPTGTWKADVSDWLAGWLLIPSFAPATIAATDRAGHPAAAKNRYVTTTKNATPTEAWLAARMDELAAHEARRGASAPIAVVGTAATDPLRHPTEPVPTQDLVSIDANHITTTPAWPAGTFAAYTAYPYAPSFLALQPSYQGDDNPYRAYLTELRAHHAGLPMMVTEFGVPASIGRTGEDTGDWRGGFLSEKQALQADADMLRMFRDIGLSGGLLTSWTDDWGAQAPPTARRSAEVAPARRALFHDPLTSTQWFGLLAHDPVRSSDVVVHEDPSAEMTRVTVAQDASFLYMTYFFTRRVTSPVDVGLDLFPGDGNRLPGGTGTPVYDVALRLIPTMSTTTVYVRRTLDPVRLDGLSTLYMPRADARGWAVQRLTSVPQVVTDAHARPPQMFKVGELVFGSWDPADPDSSSLATWELVRPDATRPMEWRLRLPWSLLALADPAGRQGLVPKLGEPTLTEVTGMDVMVESSTPGSPARFHVDLPGWSSLPRPTERLRAGMDELSTAFDEVSAPAQG